MYPINRYNYYVFIIIKNKKCFKKQCVLLHLYSGPLGVCSASNPSLQREVGAVTVCVTEPLSWALGSVCSASNPLLQREVGGATSAGGWDHPHVTRSRSAGTLLPS